MKLLKALSLEMQLDLVWYHLPIGKCLEGKTAQNGELTSMVFFPLGS